VAAAAGQPAGICRLSTSQPSPGQQPIAPITSASDRRPPSAVLGGKFVDPPARKKQADGFYQSNQPPKYRRPQFDRLKKKASGVEAKARPLAEIAIPPMPDQRQALLKRA